MVDLSRKYDVLVIGGGNASLCAAISARRILPMQRWHLQYRCISLYTNVRNGCPGSIGVLGGRMSLTSSHRADGMSSKYDVLVIGGGNAALCAAISARRGGASVRPNRQRNTGCPRRR